MLDVFKRKIELGVNIESYVEVKEPIRLEGVQTGEKKEEGEEGGMWYQWEVGDRDLRDPQVIMEYLIVRFLSVIPKESRGRVSFCFGSSLDVMCCRNLLRLMAGEVPLRPVWLGVKQGEESEEEGITAASSITTPKQLNFSDLYVYNLCEPEQFAAAGEMIKAKLGDKEAASLAFPSDVKVVDLSACSLSIIPVSLATLNDRGGVVVRLDAGKMEGLDREIVMKGDSGAIIRHAKGMLSGERFSFFLKLI